MPKAKNRKLRRAEKLSFCPDCGRRFASETNVLQHMNQPSNACGSLLREVDPSPQVLQPEHFSNVPDSRQSPLADPLSPGIPGVDLDDTYYQPKLEDRDFDMRSQSDGAGSPLSDSSIPNTEYYPGAAQAFPGGKTFMDDFFTDGYAGYHRDNLYYPFASRGDWQLGSWLLRSGLSMAAIDSFLQLDFVKTLAISFKSSKQLRLRAEMLPSGPRWKSLSLRPQFPTKSAVSLYYRDPVECLQALLSHPFFENDISFVPRKVWTTAARLTRVYDSWLSGDHAWELQSNLPPGSTLLGVTLSSNKTNISIMSGNHLAHPLLISLANIDANVRSKGSLHGHLLLTLLPVPAFIHKRSRVRSLLCDRLFHECLNTVLQPLKVTASVGIMMSDPVGNLRYCFTPLVGYIADTPEQGLLACTSPSVSPVSTATKKQFGDNFRHPPRISTKTLSDIHAICLKFHPDDFLAFLKAAKSFGLNGVDVPFWIDWPLTEPARFLKPEVLHQFHRLFFDHDLQWCIIVVGDDELDYRFSLVRTPIGYRAFKEGVSKLKQVTGRDHRAMQRYIIGIVAGAVPPRFLIAIRSLMDFRYLAQMPSFDEDVLQRLDEALRSFHDHKDSILEVGARSDHFHIPKLEILQHVVPSIRESGAVMQWSADVTEHAHVTEVKKPVRAGNNQDHYSQIARHLDRVDKCFRFDLATQIASTSSQGWTDMLSCEHDEDEDRDDEGNELNEEEKNKTYYYSTARKVVDYFRIARSLSADSDQHLGIPRPLRTFASLNTAIHLSTKPSLRMTIPEASDLFGLPDLLVRPAICTYLDRCSTSDEHGVSGQRQTSYRTEPSTENIQIWTKIRVQQRTWHDQASVEPAQTVLISPPSPKYPSGRYDHVIVSPTADSSWPTGGLNDHLIVQLRLVFRPLNTDCFLAYVQRFIVSPTTDPATGMHTLKRALRRDGSQIGDVIPVSHIRSPVHLIPRFGKAANHRLNSDSSYELSPDFWLNKFWNKQLYYSLTL